VAQGSHKPKDEVARRNTTETATSHVRLAVGMPKSRLDTVDDNMTSQPGKLSPGKRLRDELCGFIS